MGCGLDLLNQRTHQGIDGTDPIDRRRGIAPFFELTGVLLELFET